MEKGLPAQVAKLAARVAEEGGELFVVGGWVRDRLCGVATKDVDLEVHGLKGETLEALLASMGRVDLVGRSFGVYKCRIDGETFDISLPRRDSRSGAGAPDPFMGLEEALRRRDLTLNAIALRPLSGELIDPFGGRGDIERGVLRAVDRERFGDDPLRVLRAARFASKFDFSADEELISICRSQALGGLPAERVAVELHRTMFETAYPWCALELLESCGQLEVVVPGLGGHGLEAVIDGWKRALGFWRERSPECRGRGERLALMWGLMALLGSVDVLATLKRLRLRSVDGIPLQRAVTGYVELLGGEQPPLETTLRSAAEFAPTIVTVALLHALGEKRSPVDVEALARHLGVEEGPLPQLVNGAALRGVGLSDGPEMGYWLRVIREKQLCGELSTEEEALQLVTSRLGDQEFP